jgi:hypothetical protein
MGKIGEEKGKEAQGSFFWKKVKIMSFSVSASKMAK